MLTKKVTEMTAMNYQKLSDYQYTHKYPIVYKGSGSARDVIRRKFELANPKPKIKPKKKKKISKNARTYLNVPYSQKDDVKALGAKWDAKKKRWYCNGDPSKLKRWK